MGCPAECSHCGSKYGVYVDNIYCETWEDCEGTIVMDQYIWHDDEGYHYGCVWDGSYQVPEHPCRATIWCGNDGLGNSLWYLQIMHMTWGGTCLYTRIAYEGSCPTGLYSLADNGCGDCPSEVEVI